MKKPGRPSAASMEIAQIGVMTTVERPDAPYDLTDEQTQEWWSVVNRLPADWFPRETHAILAQYCRHVVSARKVAQLIGRVEKSKSFDVDAYDKLLKMQEREGRAISSLATRMRISQQSTLDRERKKPVEIDEPWND